jgi:hypothetical protein
LHSWRASRSDFTLPTGAIRPTDSVFPAAGM